jgi:HPt (histidine-containing phosphotransfer) domain-containing protein
VVSDDPDMLDRNAFDAFAELFDEAELREVIAEWHVDAETALARISDSLERGDLAEIGQVAHRAAGGSLALGASALAALWEQLRGAAESGRGIELAELDRVRAMVEATKRALCAAAGLE